MTDEIKTDQVNGSTEAPQPELRKATLAECKQMLTHFVLEGVKRGDGMYAIDPRELLANSEVDACRISALADLLVKHLDIDPKELADVTIDKMTRRIVQLQTERGQKPRIQEVHGSLPPRKGP